MKRSSSFVLLLTAIVSAITSTAQSATSGAGSAKTCDVVIYGGTSAGVAAAIQAKRMGKTGIGSEGQSKNWESNLSATRT